MQAIPDFTLGLLNGWAYIVAYYIGLIATAISFPTEKRNKLFYEPVPPQGCPWKVYLTIGRIAAITFNLLLIWTPLQIGSVPFVAGSVVYLLGYVVVMVSLVNFKRTLVDEMVTCGLYRFSRNPQWVGLSLLFLGTALAVASWLHLGMVLILVVAYHFQILTEEKACEDFYGKVYLDYTNKIPRYLLWR